MNTVQIPKSEFPDFITKLTKTINYQFDSNKAELFGINIVNDNIEYKSLSSCMDVYELIATDDIELLVEASSYDYLTIGTCGWAAPTNENNDEDNEIAPSQHPERKRVKLLCTSNTIQIGSSIMFKDKQDEEPINDFGKAKGSLADAFGNFVKQSFAFKQFI